VIFFAREKPAPMEKTNQERFQGRAALAKPRPPVSLEEEIEKAKADRRRNCRCAAILVHALPLIPSGGKGL